MTLKVGDKVRPSEGYLEKIPQDARLTGEVLEIFGDGEGLTPPRSPMHVTYPVRVMLSNGSEGLATEDELVLLEAEEPHIWEVYVNILDGQGSSKFYQQLSLHATKEGAEAEVEKHKEEYPMETSDPNFIVAARKLKIGA